MEQSINKKKEIIESIIEGINEQIEEKDQQIREICQNGGWNANCADTQAEVVCMQRKISELRLYLEMIDLNPVDTPEYKLGMKKINNQIIMHNHKTKHWK